MPPNRRVETGLSAGSLNEPPPPGRGLIYTSLLGKPAGSSPVARLQQRTPAAAKLAGEPAAASEAFMIVGSGIDIAEVPRIRGSIERFGNRFLERVFTPGEIRYCEAKANSAERYAARFAAKEAAMKALGTGWNHGVRWRDIEVAREPGGRPVIVFHGKAAEVAGKLGAVHTALSLSHTCEQAIAVVLLESETRV